MDRKRNLIPKGKIVEILGIPGSGKTTLATWLSEQTSCKYIDADIFVRNPFLSLNSSDPQRWCFTTGLCFSYERAQQAERLIPLLRQSAVVLDSSFDMGIYVYSKNRYLHQEMTEAEWDLLTQIHTALMSRVPPIDYTVVVDVPVEVILERIKERNRPHEKAYTREFIQDLQLRLMEYKDSLWKEKRRRGIMIFKPLSPEQNEISGDLKHIAEVMEHYHAT